MGVSNTRWTTDSKTKALSNTTTSTDISIFKDIAVSGQTTVSAIGNSDTLTLVAGSNIAITTSGQAITITGTAETGDISFSGSNITSSGARVSILDQVTITPAADSTTTFLVEDTDGNDIFIVDTTNDNIAAKVLKALDSDGLKFKDDGGNVAIAIVDSTLKVGLGTDSPAYDLEVKGDNKNLGLSSNDRNICLFAPVGGGEPDSGTMRLYKDGGTIVSLSSNGVSYLKGGSVGIGHSSPDTLLHIEGSEPYLTLANDTAEDSDGGRESKLIFEGKQSGNEITVLAEIVAQHQGSSDDQMGEIVFKLNDGDDGTSPSKTFTMELDSGSPNFNIGSYWGRLEIYGGAALLRRNALDLNYPTALVRNTDANSLMGIAAAKTGVSTSTMYASYLGYFYFTTTDSVTGYERVGIGTGANVDTMLHIQGTVPYITLENETSEDGDGGRESKITFEGTTAAGGTYDGVQHEVGEIEVSHHGSGDDKIGQFKLSLNDGSDSDGSLTDMLTIAGDDKVLYTYGTIVVGSNASKNIAFLDSTGTNVNVNIYAGATSRGRINLTDYTSGNAVQLALMSGGNNRLICYEEGEVEIHSGVLDVYNTTESDGDGARATTLTFKGETASGGATFDSIKHELGMIKVSHSGSANDKRGKFEIFINDGDDANGSLSQMLYMDSQADGNIGIGKLTAFHADATYNIAIGTYALNSTSSSAGTNNIGIGYGAGTAITTGADNTIIGSAAGYAISTNQYNTAIGRAALGLCKPSQTADGATTTGGNNNVGIGKSAGYNLLTGNDNFFIGNYAGYYNKLSAQNVMIGSEAGKYFYQADVNGNGGRNVGIGYRAYYNGDTGTLANNGGADNVAIGTKAMGESAASGSSYSLSGNYNSAIGGLALGKLTTGNYNVGIGYSVGGELTTASYSMFLGSASGGSSGASALTGNNNMCIGYAAGYDIEGACAGSLFIGNYAGYSTTTGGLGNTAIGYQAMYTSQVSLRNTAIGYQALYTHNFGSTDYGNNIAIGYVALKALTDGQRNVAIGSEAGDQLTTGDDNVAIGYQALNTEDTGSDNVAIGNNALKDLNYDGGGNNIAIGYNAAHNTTTGLYNVALGNNTLATNTDTGFNVAIGHSALYSADIGYNVAIGYKAAYSVTSGTSNFFLGYQAGYDTTTSSDNIFIGKEAGRYKGTGAGGAGRNIAIGSSCFRNGESDDSASNSGYENVVIGYNAMSGSLGTTTGHCTAALNTFVGTQSGYVNLSGDSNVGIGNHSLYALTTGDDNVAIGDSSAPALTTGEENIVIGHNALQTEDTGSKNIAIGFESLKTQDYDGNGHNTAIGYQSMYTNADGRFNVAVGNSALYTANSDDFNVAVGYEAGYNCSNERNTYIGYRAGKNGTTGVSNVAIGAYAWHNPGLTGASSGNYNVLVGDYACNSMNSSAHGNNIMGYQGGGNLSTGDYNTILGHYNEPPSSSALYSTGVGAYVKPNNDYDIRLGMNGGVSYISRRITLSTSYTTPASGDAAHANALVKIPPFSYIERVHVTVITLSAGTADFNIQYSTTLNTASGTALTSGTEILGAGVDTSHWTVRSQATNNAASDINASSDDTAKMTWVSINKDADASEGWVGSGEIGIYITHAGSNSSSDPGADAVLQVTVYYTGAND